MSERAKILLEALEFFNEGNWFCSVEGYLVFGRQDEIGLAQPAEQGAWATPPAR